MGKEIPFLQNKIISEEKLLQEQILELMDMWQSKKPFSGKH